MLRAFVLVSTLVAASTGCMLTHHARSTPVESSGDAASPDINERQSIESSNSYEPPASLIATFPKPYEGQVKFEVSRHEINIEGRVTGLPRNASLGSHIHEFGDLGNGCLNAGAHYNPNGVYHGGPHTRIRHPGDLGNLKTDDKGVAQFSLTICNPRLRSNREFLGLAMVIHKKEDDLGKGGDAGSRSTGNSGGRITCAVLGIACRP